MSSCAVFCKQCRLLFVMLVNGERLKRRIISIHIKKDIDYFDALNKFMYYFLGGGGAGILMDAGGTLSCTGDLGIEEPPVGGVGVVLIKYYLPLQLVC